MAHRALIPLPAHTDPTETQCFQFVIPMDTEWLGMFFGALYQLTAWNSYDRDDDHTAAGIADKWKQIISDARESECGTDMTITFRQTDCLLEYSLDDGATWTTAYDGTDCLTAAIADGTILGGSALEDAIAAGKIAAGQQQGPTGAPAPGGCKDFYVTLSANQKWLCPCPIGDGDTITIDDARGGWTPDPTHYWYCPSGETYTLGGCAGGTGATDSGDPLPTVDHMRLVANYNDVWFDAYNQEYDVPDGVEETQLILQANDSEINNNLGSVTFHITICKNVLTYSWRIVMDFTLSSHHVFVYPSGFGYYATGVGFTTHFFPSPGNPNVQELDTSADTFTSFTMRRVTVYCNVPEIGASSNVVNLFKQDGSVFHTFNPSSGDNTLVWTGSEVMTSIHVSAQEYPVGSGSTVTISKMIIEGDGPMPGF